MGFCVVVPEVTAGVVAVAVGTEVEVAVAAGVVAVAVASGCRVAVAVAGAWVVTVASPVGRVIATCGVGEAVAVGVDTAG
jgi:hypothetical protein